MSNNCENANQANVPNEANAAKQPATSPGAFVIFMMMPARWVGSMWHGVGGKWQLAGGRWQQWRRLFHLLIASVLA